MRLAATRVLLAFLISATLLVPVRAEKTNLITDPDAWALTKLGTADAALTRDDEGLKVVVTHADGTEWHVMVAQDGITLREGQSYLLRFRAKADARRPISVRGSVTEQDYHDIGLSQTLTLNTDWRTYQMPFTAARLVPGHVGVPQFLLGATTGTVWLSDISLVSRVTPNPASPPAPPARPRRGEISLSGSIRTLSPQKDQLVMWVTQIVMPEGAPKNFDPPRLKVVRLLPNTKLSPDGMSRKLLRSALKVGDTVTVTGADRGQGLPLAAGQVQVATAPQ